jgi:HPt (histidine-containing phosphotransfer) domain-containing protein
MAAQAPRALQFPRADGPALPDVAVAAAVNGAGAATAGADCGRPVGGRPAGLDEPVDAADRGRLAGPAAAPRVPHAPRGRSIAVMMIGALVLVIGWSMGIGYAVSAHGVETAFQRDDVDRIESAVTVADAALIQEAARVVAAARALRSDPQLLQVLGNPTERAAYLAEVRGRAGVDEIEVAAGSGSGGAARGHAGEHPAGESGPPEGAAGDEEPLSVETQANRLVLAIRGPLLRDDDSVAGAVVVRRNIDRAWLRETVGRAGVDLALLTAEAVVLSTDPQGAAALDRTAVARALAEGHPVPFARPGQYGAVARPVRLGERPLAVVSYLPATPHHGDVNRARRQWVSIAALTLVVAALLGWVLTRRLLRPIEDLTLRAEQLTVRHAGRPVPRHGTQLQSLVAAFETMTAALLGHAGRLQHAHMNELQNSLELQRQYALMRLLRNLAAAADESQTVEETLERALQEIGEYLDWPIGRVVLPPPGHDRMEGPCRSIWFVRDHRRFEPFMAASNGAAIGRDPSQFIGRAFVSGMPHWVSDLARLTEWSRRAPALAAGLRSGLVIPVIAQGHASAFIEFFTDHRVDATAEMLELIEAINAELWRVAERHRIERDLRARAAGAIAAPVGGGVPGGAPDNAGPVSGESTPVADAGFRFDLPVPIGAPSLLDPALDPALAPVLDPVAIDRIRDMERRGAAKLLERLVRTYLATAGRLVDDVEAGFAREDVAAVRLAAHTLKSSSASLGAAALGGTCAAIESCALEGRLEDARALWRGARDEFLRVCTALRVLLEAPVAA